MHLNLDAIYDAYVYAINHPLVDTFAGKFIII